MLDLTDRDVLAAWSLDAGALSGDDWHPCQEVARQARRSGYEAIRFPSATGKGVNLAVFLDRLLPGSLLRVLEEKPLTVPVRYT